MKKVLLAVLALIPCLAMAAPGTYISVQAGGNQTGEWGFTDATGFATGANIGYLWGDNTFDYGVEAGAFFYPDSTGNTTIGLYQNNYKYDGYNISLLGVLKYITASGFDFFGKAGGAYVNQTLNNNAFIVTPLFDIPISSSSITTSTIAPEIDLGLGYQFNQNIELNLTGNTIFARDGTASNNNSPDTSDNLLVGLTYTFA